MADKVPGTARKWFHATPPSGTALVPAGQVRLELERYESKSRTCAGDVLRGLPRRVFVGQPHRGAKAGRGSAPGTQDGPGSVLSDVRERANVVVRRHSPRDAQHQPDQRQVRSRQGGRMA